MDILFSERLVQERKRLGLSQETLAAFGQVQKRAQNYYEQGERLPDVRYLAGISSVGVDLLYLVLGKRTPLTHESLSEAEEALVRLWRGADAAKQAALETLLAAFAAPAAPKQTAGARSIQIAGALGAGSILSTGDNLAKRQPKAAAKKR